MKRKKIIIISSVISISIISFIYIPQFFIKNNNQYTNQLNTSILDDYNTYMNNHLEDDFDNDGLTNEEELELGSNIYLIDTDFDGLSDKYEKNNGTSIIRKDNVLEKQLKKTLDIKNYSYKNPFESNGFVLWANNLTSRTYGNIIPTLNGTEKAYIVDNFDGLIKIPDNKYPYHIENGYYEELIYDKKNDLYKVYDGYKIVLENQPYKTIYETHFFTNKANYSNDNIINRILNVILPQKGFITSKKITEKDTLLDLNTGKVLTSIPSVNYDINDLSRFKYNNILLSDLNNIYNNINSGFSIAVSLIDDVGETIGLVYGYDKYGNLLIANTTTKEYLGTITVSEHYLKEYIDENNSIDYFYFSFKGMGYDSKKNARISFFAISD